MKDFSRKFLRDASGATAIEYAMIAGGIALVLIATINAIGGLVLRDVSAANAF